MIESKRKDGRGHWPKGRRFHTRVAEYSPRKCAIFIERRRRRGIISRAQLARHCRVDPRTVTRWMRGEDWPAPKRQHKVIEWLRLKQEWVRRESLRLP